MSNVNQSNGTGSLSPQDELARAENLYGIDVLKCESSRNILIATPKGPRKVIDCLSNSPFSLNTHKDVVKKLLILYCHLALYMRALLLPEHQREWHLK